MLQSGDIFEDEGSDLGDTDDAGDKLYGEGDIALEFFLDSAGDFKLIIDGEVLFRISDGWGATRRDVW